MEHVTTSQRWYFTLLLLVAAAGCNRSDAPQAAPTASLASGTGDQPSGQSSLPSRDAAHPVVQIETTLGTVTVELDAERTPITAKNFLWYVNNGQYQNTIFHQVLRDYVAIGGGYLADLTEKPTNVAIRNEADRELKNRRGTLAMARRPDDINSSTCQFFFNLVDNPNLDQKSRNSAAEFGYCVFGRVTGGLEVLDRMSAVPVADKSTLTSVPVTPIVIKSVKRIR